MRTALLILTILNFLILLFQLKKIAELQEAIEIADMVTTESIKEIVIRFEEETSNENSN